MFEVQQAHLALIEDTRIVVGRILRQDLDVPIPQTTDAELIEMIVPPVESGLNSEMQMLQVPMDGQDQTPPMSGRISSIETLICTAFAGLNMARMNRVGGDH
ncbi:MULTISPECIES: hypothetical protein [unclassified Rhizobium]|uniref:hypothetical protein n=1 Tax=unclassified Rhizobium TaxID=2613769 RepID=UPI00184296D3|nr:MULTISPECIES: hypothetical protein [unclassified Rhizobium]MBB3387105.1 hypothetical protein [Rhizobium sp. BK098]MBB3618806.1 hypothetical protein [Rhizobium sp. BK609]MBB3684466.1 hypothetical protein [Rhizobium sp. BK612]